MSLKRSLIVLAMVAIVCAAVYMNYSFQQANETSAVSGEADSDAQYPDGKVLGEAMFVSANGDVETAASIKKDYFTEARMNRQTTRDEATELLKSIASDKNNSEEVRKKAASDLAEVAAAVEKEGKIESLISAKGFANSLAVMGESSISVMIETTGLSMPELAQIKEIIINETGFSGPAIKIIEIK